MNTKPLLMAFLIAASAAIAQPAKVLLMGDPGSTIQRAIVDELSILAKSIVYDEASKTLHCAGSVELHSGATVAKAANFSIELGAKTVVCYLNSRGIEIKADQPSEPPSIAGSAPAGQNSRQP